MSEATAASLPVNFQQQLEQLPFAYASTKVAGNIRQSFADFQVDEILSFTPSGEGEHLFVQVEKQGCNTDWVAEQLQLQFGLRSQDIGYAGKKDRHSISKQWFSLHVAGKQIDATSINNDSFQVIQQIRHNKKLRKGAIAENRFKIVVREVSASLDPVLIEQIKQNGVPNYFGYQRFGHQANNLNKARQMFSQQIKIKSRNKRGLYLSAARSYLFNLLLALRVKDGSWNKPLNGDCLNLNQTQSFFMCEQVDAQIIQRIHQADLHVSGWMAGVQPSQAQADAAYLEQQALVDYSKWIAGLCAARLASTRRAFRMMPANLSIETPATNVVVLSFALPTGCFATSLLREIFEITDLATLPSSLTAQQEPHAND